MAEFAYNNIKNASTSHISFELNCNYYPKMSFKFEINPRLRSCSANELAKELKKLIEICCQNLLHGQELLKKAYDKKVNNRSYTTSKKV